MTYLSDLPELGLASDWLTLFGSDRSDGSDEDTSCRAIAGQWDSVGGD